MIILLVKIQKILQIFYNKYKKPILCISLVFLISSLGIFIFGAGEARAGWVVDNFIKGILITFGYILLGILWLFGQILNAAAGLVSGFLSYTLFTKAPIVIMGWGIVRDLVNMFFVLILLVIAFATILRIDTYGMKQILWKLIVAALLINFSLVLVGPIIDFSQLLTQFFVDGSGGTNFTTKISTALNLSKISSIKEKECTGGWEKCNDYYAECIGNCGFMPTDQFICKNDCQSICCECKKWELVPVKKDYNWGKGVMDTVNVIMGLSMSITFSIIAIFAFLAFAFFLIVRILIIWFLLILAPIAWFFWILPATQKLFSQWWDAFIKWVFFAPIYMFFVYLALKTFPTFLYQSVLDASETGVDPDILLPELLSFKYLLRFVLVVGLLLGGLIVAQKMSVFGAKGAIGIAKGIGGKVSGITATQRWWKARGAAREKEAKERVENKQRLSRVSGAGQWTREHLRLTPKGRAEARTKKNTVVTQETQRMGKSMNRQDVQKVAGRRTLPFGAGKTQKLAAQSLLANPRSAEYNQMMSRSTKLRPGIPKYEKLKKLARRVNLNVVHREKAGEFNRYKLKQEKGKKGKPVLNEQQKIIMPSENKEGFGEKISYAEREKIKKEAGIT